MMWTFLSSPVFIRSVVRFPGLPRQKPPKRHFCPFCQYSTVQSTHFKDHLKTHTGERPYQCDICGRRFARKLTCQRHYLIHNKIYYWIFAEIRKFMLESTFICWLVMTELMSFSAHDLTCVPLLIGHDSTRVSLLNAHDLTCVSLLMTQLVFPCWLLMTCFHWSWLNSCLIVNWSWLNSYHIANRS